MHAHAKQKKMHMQAETCCKQIIACYKKNKSHVLRNWYPNWNIELGWHSKTIPHRKSLEQNGFLSETVSSNQEW